MKEIAFLKKRLLNVYAEELQHEIAVLIGEIIRTMESHGRHEVACRMQISLRTQDAIVETSTLNLANGLTMVKLMKNSVIALRGETNRQLEL